MRHVMVMNSKGGCGKSTIATNLASHFAGEGYKVALADYDPQRTSLERAGDRGLVRWIGDQSRVHRAILARPDAVRRAAYCP